LRTTKTVTHVMTIIALMGSQGAALLAEDGAANRTISTRLDAAYVSRYVWRGIPQTSSGAVQPSLTFAHSGGLSYNFWASYDLDKSDFTEHDHTLNYSWSAGRATMNAGYIYYAFPNTSYLSTSEVYASACFGGALSPTISVNCDIDEAEGFYAGLSASHAWPIAIARARTPLSLSAKLSFSSASYNKYWFGKDESTISDLYVSAAIPTAVSDCATLTPSLSYYTIIDGDLRDGLSAMGLDSHGFICGLTASYAF